MTTRNGKIARRPKAVCRELHCRQSEGEPGASLVEWLNERDDVKTVLRAAKIRVNQTGSNWIGVEQGAGVFNHR